MKKRWIVLVAVVVMAAILVVSFAGRGEEGADVYVEPVMLREIAQIVKASGVIDPRLKVELSPEVAGRVARLPVKEGERINSGDLFLQLQQTSFQADVDRARAALSIARSDLRQSELVLENARLNSRRIERLADQQIVPDHDVEQALLDEQTAALRVEQSREAVLQAEAALDQAEENYSRTTIYAPLSGTIVELDVEEGETVIPGTTNLPGAKLGVIADLSEVLAVVDVDETEIVDVEHGQEATVVVDALPDQELSGRVVEVGSSGFQRPDQPDVTYFKVEILLEDPVSTLRPGMSARAEILTAERPDTLVVPIQAVVQREPVRSGSPEESSGSEGDGEIQVVFAVEGGEALQLPVQVGLSDATSVEITDGLEEGQEIVTGPYRTLKDLEAGDAVTVTQPGRGDDAGEDEENRIRVGVEGE